MSQIDSLVDFILRAKRAAYASGEEPTGSSRPASKDHPYQEGSWYYLDSFLGGHKFAGEEIVWESGVALWGMNYYGWMETAEMPPGFSQFLKHALQNVPGEAPYRGPAAYNQGDFTYTCTWTGEVSCFQGEEWIALGGERIYRLVFHGGFLLD